MNFPYLETRRMKLHRLSLDAVISGVIASNSSLLQYEMKLGLFTFLIIYFIGLESSLFLSFSNPL